MAYNFIFCCHIIHLYYFLPHRSDSDLEIVVPAESETAEILQAVGHKQVSKLPKFPNTNFDLHMKPFIIESTVSMLTILSL